MFSLDIYIEVDGDYKEYRIQYESSNGLNYTRTRFESDGEPLENPVDLTTLVKWGSRYGEAQWNDLIGYFMIVGSSYYQGLWRYSNISNQYNLIYNLTNAYQEAVYGNKCYFGTNYDDTTGVVMQGTLQNTTGLSIEQMQRRVNLYNDLSYLELNENVTDVSQLFYNCTNLTNIPNFDTSNVTNMATMFYYCTNLTNIPNFDTSNVTNMSHSFRGCNNLVDVPQLNTSNVTYMSCSFRACNNLTNNSIQNIINMCLNSNITNRTLMNLNNTNMYSPLNLTKFDNMYYQNRWSELTSAGWTY